MDKYTLSTPIKVRPPPGPTTLSFGDVQGNGADGGKNIAVIRQDLGVLSITFCNQLYESQLSSA